MGLAGVLLALLVIPPAAQAPAQPPTLPDWWMIRWTLPTNTAKYPLDNYQLDFYVDSGWWLDGIGKQVMYGLYAITNFIWTISLCTFPRHRASDSGSLLTGLHFTSTADSIGESNADPGERRRCHRRLSSGGILCRVPADSHSEVVKGFTLPTQGLSTGNHKSHPCRCQLRGGVRAVRFFIAYAPDYIGKINEFR